MTATAAFAQPLPEAAAQLASRTSSLLPRRPTVSLDLQNLSTLPAADWANFRSLLRSRTEEGRHREGGRDLGLSRACGSRLPTMREGCCLWGK